MIELKPLIHLFLKKAFDIREGEVNRAVLMMVYIFLIISTLLIVKPAVNSLFLSKFGVAQLPYAFILVSLFAAVIITIYSRLLKTTSLEKIIIKTLTSSIIVLSIFWVLFKFNFLEGWAVYLFYIWVSIFAVISGSQFWILANVIFNAREAKRLFGFIGAGAIAGGIFGGYLTTILAGLIGSENLIIVCILFISLCIPIAKTIWKNNVEPIKTKFQRRKAINTFTDHPVKLIRKSKHLLYLASIVGISVIVAKLVDYQFNAVASSEIYNADDLTAFFGFWYSNLNIVSLVIQLFITRRVVGTFGVGTSLFFLPAGIFLGTLGVLVDPALWAAVLLKINDGSLKQSVHKSSMELLALPIPTEIKNQTKSFIDIFIDSLSTGIGGIVLILFTDFLGFNVRFISLITILFLGAWFYLALKVRQEYLKSFKLRIEHEKDLIKHIPDLKNESIISSLIKVLETGADKQKLIVLKMVKDIHNDALAEPLKKLLNSNSAIVKIEALQHLNSFTSIKFHNEVEKLIYDKDFNVRYEAFNYLFEHPVEDEFALITKHVNNPDVIINEPALLAAAFSVSDNPELKDKLNLSASMRKKNKSLAVKLTDVENEHEKKLIAKVIGLGKLEDLYPELNELLKDSNPEVVKAAIYSAGQTLNSFFISAIIPYLLNEKFREETKTALLNFGPLVVDYLNNLINNSEINIDVRRIIPSILEKIGTQKSVDVLLKHIDNDEISIRTESLRALNVLRKNFSYLNFVQKGLSKKVLSETKMYLDTLSVLYVQINTAEEDSVAQNQINEGSIHAARSSLIKLIERRLDGNLERIFRLLGLKYPPEEMIEAYKSLQSNKPDLRLNAIEFLDNLLDPSLKRIIIPLVESTSENIVSDKLLDEFDIKIPTEYECLEMLLKGTDQKLIIAALYLIVQLKNSQYQSLAAEFTNHKNEKVKNMASLALTSSS